MSQLAINQRHCDDLITMAEQEFAAFFRTVTELFGSGLAELSAEDWLHELDASNCLPTSVRDWRRITLNAFKRLAARLNASSIATASLVLA